MKPMTETAAWQDKITFVYVSVVMKFFLVVIFGDWRIKLNHIHRAVDTVATLPAKVRVGLRKISI